MVNKRIWLAGGFIFFYMQQGNATDSNKQLSAQMHFLIGAGASSVSAVITEPLLFFKNFWQQQRKLRELLIEEKISYKALLHIAKKSYRGLPVNLVGSVPVFATQNMIHGFLSNWAKNVNFSQLYQNLLPIIGASIVTTLLSCPRELLIVNQQNKGGNFIKVSKEILKDSGLGAFERGFAPTFIRNSSYATNLFLISPRIKKELSAYIKNSFVLSVASGITAGSFSAVLTHPFDTVKTYMQADFKSGGMFQSFKH